MATALQVQAIIRSLEEDEKKITQSVADLTAEAAQEVEPQAEKKSAEESEKLAGSNS